MDFIERADRQTWELASFVLRELERQRDEEDGAITSVSGDVRFVKIEGEMNLLAVVTVILAELSESDHRWGSEGPFAHEE